MNYVYLFKIRDDYLRACLSVSFYCSSLEKAHNPNISHSSVVLCMHIGLCMCVCVCMYDMYNVCYASLETVSSLFVPACICQAGLAGCSPGLSCFFPALLRKTRITNHY